MARSEFIVGSVNYVIFVSLGDESMALKIWEQFLAIKCI